MFARKEQTIPPTVTARVPSEVAISFAEIQARVAEWDLSERQAHEFTAAGSETKPAGRLHERLTTTGIGLGLLRLQLDAGLTDEARATLVAIQKDFELLLHGMGSAVENWCPGSPSRRCRSGKLA